MAGGHQYSFVDGAKGIGICLVVAGHAIGGLLDTGLYRSEHWLRYLFMWIYVFHMPLFFVLSGLFAGNRCKEDPRAFMVASLRWVLLPYVLWSVLQSVSRSLAGDAVNRPTSDLSLELWSLAISPPGQFWFLYALFLMHLYTVLTHRLGLVFVGCLALALTYAVQAADLTGIVAIAVRFLPYYIAGLLFGATLLKPGIQFPPAIARIAIYLVAVLLSIYLWSRIDSEQTASFLASALAHEIASFAWSGEFLGMGVAIGLAVIVLAAEVQRFGFAGVVNALGRRSMDIYVMHVMFLAGMRIVLHKVLAVQSIGIVLPAITAVGLLAPLVIGAMLRRIGWARFLGLK